MNERELGAAEAERIAKAQAIWNASVAIEGTLGDAYLRGRGIDRWPADAARWHAKNNALVFAATSAEGEIRAVQRLFFAADGAPILEKGGKKLRRTNGVLYGTALTLRGEGGVLLCEGAEDGLTLWGATGRTVLAALGVSAIAAAPVPVNEPVTIAKDNDKPDSPAHKKTDAAARALTKDGHAVSIVMPPANIKDANELLTKQGEDAVRDMVAAAMPFVAPSLTPEEIEAEVEKLADLPRMQYETSRKGEAKRLGLRASYLDKIVAKADERAKVQGRAIELPEPEPWPDHVDGSELLSALIGAISRYVILPENGALTIALWVLHSFIFDATPCTPRLAIGAPEKRCGKTTLLDVLGVLVQRPLLVANISAAAVFRTVEACRPTLLLDEADSFLRDNEDLRNVLDSGYRTGGNSIRTVGENFEPRVFSTHCPVAIALIGKLKDTVSDRSIHIAMKRKLPGETTASFRHGRTGDLAAFANKAARWVVDNAAAIRVREPDMPTGIINRAADNWAPLLAIAEVIGGAVVDQARQAALAACGFEEELSYGVMLLTDIREAFGTKKEIASVALVAALVAMCDRPWGECNRGKMLTQNWLARRLKPFGVHPKNVGPKSDQAKGYTLESFADAFKRYIPPDSTVHPYTANKNIGLDENQTVHQTNEWTDANADNPLNSNEVYGWTDENPQTGDARGRADDLATDDDAWRDGF